MIDTNSAEFKCYRKLYGDLVFFVDHYWRLDFSPGAVNQLPEEFFKAKGILIPKIDKIKEIL